MMHLDPFGPEGYYALRKTEDARCVPKNTGHSGRYKFNVSCEQQTHCQEPARRRRYEGKASGVRRELWYGAGVW